MPQKCHLIAAPVGAQQQFTSCPHFSAEAQISSCRPGVPIRLGIRIFLASAVVLVCLKPADIARGFLIKITALYHARDTPVLPVLIEPDGGFSLLVPRLLLIPAVTGRLRRQSKTIDGTAGRGAIVVSGARLERSWLRFGDGRVSTLIMPCALEPKRRLPASGTSTLPA